MVQDSPLAARNTSVSCNLYGISLNQISLLVFRNQLPRKNDTYSYGPPPDSPPPASKESISFQLKCGPRLCRVCGCSGPKTCSKCHKVNYCSRVHQLMDWKLQHKQLCNESFGKFNWRRKSLTICRQGFSKMTATAWLASSGRV